MKKYKGVEIEATKSGWYVASLATYDKAVGIYYKTVKADTLEGIQQMIDAELKAQ